MIHTESPALECCLAISFMHFPEFLMVFGQGLDNEGVASVNIWDLWLSTELLQELLLMSAGRGLLEAGSQGRYSACSRADALLQGPRNQV